MITDDDIRRVFLAAGFTVKEGQTDLKPYVFEAGRKLVALAVAAERERCAAWVDARKDAFCDAHGYIDPDTGCLEFGRGHHAQEKHDYVSELEEIADGLRNQPPATGNEQP